VARSLPRRTGSALAWLGLLLAVSIAGAGLVVALDHPRTEGGRPELTAVAHATLAPRLADLDAAMAELAGRAEAVSTSGREVLGMLRTLDVDAVDAALAAGTLEAGPLEAALSAVRTVRSGLLMGIDPARLPGSDVDRIAAVDVAVEAAGDVPSAWTAIAAAAGGPVDLLRSLDEHDRLVVAATTAGRQERWSDALDLMADAGRALRRATAVRDSAASAGRDVTTLDDWLARSSDFDAALVALYSELLGTGGIRTSTVEALLDRVDAAQDALPGDRDALVVIVSDLATTDITRLLLRVEDARAAIERAIGTLD
jgi:hypothetical protein